MKQFTMTCGTVMLFVSLLAGNCLAVIEDVKTTSGISTPTPVNHITPLPMDAINLLLQAGVLDNSDVDMLLNLQNNTDSDCEMWWSAFIKLIDKIGNWLYRAGVVWTVLEAAYDVLDWMTENYDPQPYGGYRPDPYE